MKQIHSFLLLLLCLLLGSVKAQTIQVPHEGTPYVIIHSANYVLSGAASNARIVDPTAAEDQNFEFVQVPQKPDVYTIRNQLTGTYLGLDASNGYTTVWREDPEDELSQFTIETVDEVFVKFRNVLTSRTNNYLGTDGKSPNSSVYTDKSGLDRMHHWRLVISHSGLAREFLQETVDSAKLLVHLAVPGEDIGEYPPAALAALQEVLAEAESALTGDNEKLIEARNKLNAAITIFHAEKIAFKIDPQALYYIRHSGGMFLGKGQPAVCLTIPSGLDTQQFRLLAVTEERNVFNLQLVATEEFLTKEGSYNLKWDTDESVNSAQYKIELAPDGDLVFKCLNNNAYIGTDNSTPSSGVYSNKGSGSENSHWTVVKVEPDGILTEYLELLIVTAEQLIETSPVGDKGHQWPQSAMDALVGAVNTAKEILQDPESQEIVNEGATILYEEIEVFKAAEITPMLEPKSGDKYRYSVAKYAAKYMSYNGENVRTTADRIPAGESQLWEMIPVEGNPDQFIMKQGDLAFNADDTFTLSDYDLTYSVPITLRFVRTANGIDYYGLLRGDGKVLTFGSGTNAAWQDFQTTNEAHWGIFTKADLPYDPDKSSLQAYLPTAKNQLASKVYGTESGLWSIHSRDSLTWIINEAQTMMEESGFTQEDVDSMWEKLRGTVSWHEKQKISVLLDKLIQAIADAEELLGAAVVGTKPGEFYPTNIDEFEKGPLAEAKNAMKLSVQVEIDAAAEKLRVDMEAFRAKAHTTDVEVDRVLHEAIEFAELLYQSIVPGINKGDYPESALEEFGAALERAKDSPAIQQTLDDLLAARVKFESSRLQVDRSVLFAAIQSAHSVLAQAEVGDCDGQFPQIALNTYQTEVEKAEKAYPDLTLSQDEIDTALAELRNAGTVFNSQKVVIDFTELHEAINQAVQTLNLAAVEKGEGPGTYPELAFTLFEEAIEEAKGINGSNTVNQAGVDAAVLTLSEKEAFFKASRIPNEYSGLEQKISEARIWMERTPVGEEAGQVSASAVAALRSSITQAESFLISTNQTEVNTAVTRLNKDIELFKAQIIEADVASLRRLITEVKAAIQKYNIREGVVYERLEEKLEEAEQIAEEPLVSQEVADAAWIALSNALTDYLNGTGVSSVEWDRIKVFTTANTLVVENLPDHSVVKVFTASGSLVNVHKGEELLSIALNPGVYILQIQTGEAIKSIRVSILY